MRRKKNFIEVTIHDPFLLPMRREVDGLVRTLKIQNQNPSRSLNQEKFLPGLCLFPKAGVHR